MLPKQRLSITLLNRIPRHSIDGLCRCAAHQCPYVSVPASTRRFSKEYAQVESFRSHEKTVLGLAKDVRRFYENGQQFRISHGSTNSTRPVRGRGTRFLDTSRLSKVLHVDPARMTALVEPNVPMDALVEYTLQHGLVPPVVMEFPGITAGGGYAGTSAESSSFKHGFFDRNVHRVEMILGDGDVVTCSDIENADLFRGAAGALGTLGITTLLELKLIRAKKFVRAQHHVVTGHEEAGDTIRRSAARAANDYVDGILFSENSGVVVAGRMSDSMDDRSPVQTFSKAKDPWYYLYVKDRLEKEQRSFEITVPLAEYLFRYDRGGFWVGASAFKYFGVPFNDMTRWFLDDFCHTRMLYKALHASQSEKYIVQDLALPFDKSAEFLRYVHRRFGIYPLWLCPLQQSRTPTLHPHNNTSVQKDGSLRPLLNIGLWGEGHLKPGDFLQANVDLEKKLQVLGGMKWLYAQTFYSEDQFWDMFDIEWYDALRAKYRATTLPTVYDKVRRHSGMKGTQGLKSNLLNMRPLGGLYGIWKAIRSKAYKPARTSTWPYKVEK